MGEERTDLVIRSLARFLQKKMRRSIDMIARYNHRRGDEFIIIMEPANVKDVLSKQMPDRFIDGSSFKKTTRHHEMTSS